MDRKPVTFANVNKKNQLQRRKAQKLRKILSKTAFFVDYLFTLSWFALSSRGNN